MTDEIISKALAKYEKLILEAERHIWKNPETGYREWKTNEYLKEKYEALGYTLHMAGNIPGFYTDVDTGRPGPRVLVLGELDSLIVKTHPECDPETGAVHACGHNAQCAALLGVAAALREPGMLDGLSGSIRLCAVPAEELIEIEFRQKLKEDGIITCLGGKAEFLARGYFDGCDIAFMVHTSSGESNHIACGRGSNGVIAKSFVYKGKAAHAGGSPNRGINALYAANVGLSAVNALRETFLDSELIRFHPIMTEGGTAVNSIPDRVCLESYVRGKTFDAIVRENKKINRALAAGAAALGASLTIYDSCGFAPLENTSGLYDLAERAAKKTVPEENVSFKNGFGGGSTDMGDMCCVMPALHPHISGASGAAHGSAYYITDPYSACVVSAKFQLNILSDLLSDDAAEAKKIIADFKPQFPSIKDYLAFRETLDRTFEAVSYAEDGTVTINI